MGAPKTAAATAPIPANAYKVSDPEAVGKIEVANNPKPKPVKAPSINEGENIPPPIRPAIVTTTATTLIIANIIIVLSSNCPVRALEVVSYPTPIICGNFIAIIPKKNPAIIGLNQIGILFLC